MSAHIDMKASLQEGLLDDIIDVLEKKQAELLRAWSSAKVDYSKVEVPERSEGFDPNKNPVDQMSAMIVILQTVGYSISETLAAKEFAESKSQEIELERPDEGTLKAIGEFKEGLSKLLGQATSWLKSPAMAEFSPKISKIGESVKGNDLKSLVESLAKAMEAVDRLNLERQARSILSSDAVEQSLKADEKNAKLRSAQLKQFQSATKNSSEALAFLKSLPDQIENMNALIEEKSKTADRAEVIRTDLFSEVRAYVRMILTNDLRR